MNVIDVINDIHCKEDINKYKKLLLEYIYEINNKNNFKLLLFIIIYSKCSSIFYFLKEYNVNLNLEKNGKNLLYYTSILKHHDKSNILIMFNIKIQNKFIDKYILQSLDYGTKSLKDVNNNCMIYCNHKFLLNLAYHGHDIIGYKNKIQNKYKLERLQTFIDKHKKKLEENIKSYNLWQRRKQLVYIVNQKSNQEEYDLISIIFSIDLIINNIKCYL